LNEREIMVWPLASKALAITSPAKPSIALPSKVKAIFRPRSIQVPNGAGRRFMPAITSSPRGLRN
jgi:hypothetical protein